MNRGHIQIRALPYHSLLEKGSVGTHAHIHASVAIQAQPGDLVKMVKPHARTHTASLEAVAYQRASDQFYLTVSDGGGLGCQVVLTYIAMLFQPPLLVVRAYNTHRTKQTAHNKRRGHARQSSDVEQTLLTC